MGLCRFTHKCTCAGTFAGKWINCVTYVGKSPGLAIHVLFVAKGIKEHCSGRKYICIADDASHLDASPFCSSLEVSRLKPSPAFIGILGIHGNSIFCSKFMVGANKCSHPNR